MGDPARQPVRPLPVAVFAPELDGLLAPVVLPTPVPVEPLAPAPWLPVPEGVAVEFGELELPAPV